MDRGYFTIAQNNTNVDYLRLAYGLALSIKATQKINNISIGITPGVIVPDKYTEVFDYIIEIPFQDAARRFEWKLQNEWKVFHMTPYKETIKLASDMYFPHDVSHWWDDMHILGDFHMVTKVRNHREDIISDNIHREVFQLNNLPNVYSDFTYIKKSMWTWELYKLIEIVFKNWQDFYLNFAPKETPKYMSTDVVYAIALKIAGVELCELNTPTFSHLKPLIMNIGNQVKWQNVLRVDFKTPSIRIGNYNQRYPIHYQEKDFLTDNMIKSLEKELGI